MLPLRLEYELAMEIGDLKRAFHCLVTLSNSKNLRSPEFESGNQEFVRNADVTLEIPRMYPQVPQPTNRENEMEALFGIASFAGDFMSLIDATDATGQSEINSQALTRLAAAVNILDAFEKLELRGIALRLATHRELSRLTVNNHYGF